MKIEKFDPKKALQEEKDFEKQRRRAQTLHFSPFAQFHQDLKDYNFEYKGRRFEKYEAWELGFTDAKKILAGETKIEVSLKPREKVML